MTSCERCGRTIFWFEHWVNNGLCKSCRKKKDFEDWLEWNHNKYGFKIGVVWLI